MSALIEFEEVCKYYQMGDTTVKAADHIPAWHKLRAQESSRSASMEPKASPGCPSNTGSGRGKTDVVPVDKNSILL